MARYGMVCCAVCAFLSPFAARIRAAISFFSVRVSLRLFPACFAFAVDNSRYLLFKLSLPFEDGIEVFRLIGSFFRTDKFCLYDVLNQRFKGLPVLFVHGEQKAGQHNEDHHERRKACACAAFEQKEKRQSNKERRRKEDKLSLREIESNLCLYAG